MKTMGKTHQFSKPRLSMVYSPQVPPGQRGKAVRGLDSEERPLPSG